MSEHTKTPFVLDARGLQCPLPVLRTQKMLRSMKPGDILQVVATDPAAPYDFSDFCRVANMDLLETTQQDNEFIFTIKKM